MLCKNQLNEDWRRIESSEFKTYLMYEVNFLMIAKVNGCVHITPFTKTVGSM